MKNWRATLTNGEVVESDQAGSWKLLVSKCKDKDLKIASLKYNDKEIDTRAVSYFVIHSGFASLNSELRSMRIGLGSFRPNGKCNIRWFNVAGEPLYTDHKQIIKPEQAKMYKPLAIEVEKCDVPTTQPTTDSGN